MNDRKIPGMKVWTPERIKVVRDRKLAGETLESIAKDYGVTRERIRQIILKGGDAIKFSRRHYCQLEGCERFVRSVASGWCQLHYDRVLKTGAPGPLEPKTPTLVHGTKNGYCHYRCRCELCVKENMAQRRNWKANVDTSKAPHGTHSGYTNWGCRCEPCCKANLAYNNQSNRKEWRREWDRKRRAAKK